MERELQTERLWLRPPRAGDERAAFERWAGEAELLRWMGWAAHTRLEQTRQWLAWEQARWQKRSGYTWLLLPRKRPDTGPIGLVQLLPLRFDGPSHHVRLGYVLASAWHRQGLMREALQALLSRAFEQRDVWRVDALVDVDNAPSLALMESLGFEREGRLRRHAWQAHSQDSPRDVFVFAQCRDTFKDREAESIHGDPAGVDCVSGLGGRR